MAFIDNMTGSQLSCQNFIITDTDLEKEIESSFIHNTHQQIRQLSNVAIPTSTTEILFSDNIPIRVNERAHISIIEMETSNKYRSFFIYEDLFSKYVILKPLKDASDTEIVEKLIDIFFLIGTPRILQSNHGRGYTENLVRKLRRIIPTLNIVHGNILKQDEGYRDFKTLIKTWQQKNSLKSWYEGLNFIQAFENTFKISGHENKKSQKIPAKIFFNSNLANDLAQLIGDKNSFDEIWTEEELINKTIKNDLSKSYQKDIINIAAEIKIPHECEKTEAISLAVDEEQSDDDKIHNSSTLTFPNESIDNNDKKKSIDNSNLLSIKNEVLVGMQKAVKCATSSENIFECSMCNRIFKRINHLKNHMRSHKSKIRDKRKHKNDVVILANSETDQLNNNSERIINNHIEDQITVEKEDTDNAKDEINHHKIKYKKRTVSLSKSIKKQSKPLLECQFCKKKFTFHSILERHLRSHTNERPYFCKICDKTFKQLGHLSQHAMSHIDFRSYQCPICDHKFESYQILKNHIISHKDNNDRTTSIQEPYRLYECDICKKIFTAKNALEQHIFTHTHERLYSCEICDKKFKQAGYLKSHVLIHTGEKKFDCTICFKRFTFSHTLKQHMLLHTGYKPHECKICGKRFFEKRNLDGHFLTHTGQRPHVCTICGKKYTLVNTLKRHISIAHEIGGVYQCEICTKMFKQLSYLIAHKKLHTDERPFQCYVCDKSFKHKNVLKFHLSAHFNFKPFECDDCKATFARKSYLKTHIISAHMNERPYSCYICHKIFKHNSHLNAHIMVHSNYLFYQCQYCYKRFNKLDHWKQHIQLHEKHFE